VSQGIGKVVSKSGDILDDDAKCIVIPVNCVGKLGAGLALQFEQWAAKKHPEFIEAYQSFCKSQTPFKRLRPGWPIPYLSDDGEKAVVFFPTKDHYQDKSQIDWVLVGLNALACRNFIWGTHGVAAIAFPKLGCGLGGLPWPKVRRLIEFFADQVPHLEVRVYE
jgi:hypothetical protein